MLSGFARNNYFSVLPLWTSGTLIVELLAREHAISTNYMWQPVDKKQTSGLCYKLRISLIVVQNMLYTCSP